MRNPRKARYYLRTGRLPAEEKATEEQEATSAFKISLLSKSATEFPSQKGFELVQKQGLEVSSKSLAVGGLDDAQINNTKQLEHLQQKLNQLNTESTPITGQPSEAL